MRHLNSSSVEAVLPNAGNVGQNPEKHPAMSALVNMFFQPLKVMNDIVQDTAEAANEMAQGSLVYAYPAGTNRIVQDAKSEIVFIIGGYNFPSSSMREIGDAVFNGNANWIVSKREAGIFLPRDSQSIDIRTKKRSVVYVDVPWNRSEEEIIETIRSFICNVMEVTGSSVASIIAHSLGGVVAAKVSERIASVLNVPSQERKFWVREVTVVKPTESDFKKKFRIRNIVTIATPQKGMSGYPFGEDPYRDMSKFDDKSFKKMINIVTGPNDHIVRTSLQGSSHILPYCNTKKVEVIDIPCDWNHFSWLTPAGAADIARIVQNLD